MREFVGILTAAMLAGGCSSTPVALNERLFQLDTLAPVGGGCSLYDLGSGNGSGSGGNALGLTISQQSDGGDQVIVDVIALDGVGRIEKSYDAAFIVSGQVDEFLVPAAAGAVLLLKHWGAPQTGAANGCAALDDPGPPGPYDAATGTTSATSAP